ncbi:hypothetical protein ABMY26_34360 [Azospirillum sp. HJ39]|uniref:hypothetical protein n=1 Tax=Azospirillum sp. HJ39 TaxID=3159496 RepID=UPI00355721F1
MNRDHSSAHSRSNTHSLLSRYCEAVVKLRQAAAWNSFDEERRRGGIRIVPMVDADVVRLFMAPGAELRYIDPFNQADMQDVEVSDAQGDGVVRNRHGAWPEEAWNGPLTLFATITAEYLFLNREIIVGGKSVSNWREPLRIAPSHLEDVQTMLHQVQLKIQNTPDLVLKELDDFALEKIDDAHRQALERHEDPVRSVVDALPGALRKLFLGPVREAMRWLRLVENNQLLSMEGLNEGTRTVVEPDSTSVSSWRSRLRRELNTSLPAWLDSSSKIRREKRLEERASRDAKALVGVMALNEAGLSPSADDPPWRVILVTGDDHLHRVYARWFWSGENSNKDLDHYVLRRPLQFSPVLNLRSMSDDPEAGGIFDNLVKALDVTIDLIFGRETSGTAIFRLENKWDRAQQEAGRQQTANDTTMKTQIDRCSHHWLEAINLINARNHAYFSQEFTDILKKLHSILDEADAKTSILEWTSRCVDALDSEHLRMSLWETISRIEKLDRPQRMPVQICCDFSNLLGKDYTLAQLLTGSAAIDTDRREILEKIGRRVSEELTPEGIFLMAVLSAGGGAFGLARHHIRMAQRRAKKPPSVSKALEMELTYFDALIDRFTLDKGAEEQMRRARKSLADLYLRAKQAPISARAFLQARALSEQAALVIDWYIFAPALRCEYLTEARKRLKEAEQHLSFLMRPDARPEERELATQIVVNTMCVQVLGKICGEPVDSISLARARDSFGMIHGVMHGELDYISELWKLAADWLLQGGDDKCRRVFTHCEKVLNGNIDPPLIDSDRVCLELVQQFAEGGGTLTVADCRTGQ